MVLGALLSVTAWASAAVNGAWTRERAADALATVDTSLTLQSLTELTVAGAETDLLTLLDETRRRSEWPEPARDAVVFTYTRSLSELPADAVTPALVSYLSTYAPLTQIPHEDHPTGVVPLFNVRAAMRGVEHGWLRQEARLEGLALLRSRPGSLVDAFALESHPAVRAGYLEALEQAPVATASLISDEAGQRLTTNAELTPIAARAALLSREPAALHHVLKHGQGPALQHLMQALGSEPPTRLLDLLNATLDSPHPENAALGLALLYPPLSGSTDADSALLARLGDPTLGSAAALALGHSASGVTRQALEAVATTGDRTAARRARLALELAAESDAGGGR